MEKCGQSCILEHADIGFNFRPSGQDICEFYLKLKIQGKELPCTHMIANQNLFEDHSTPWEILKSDDSCWSLSTESSNTGSKNRKTKKVMYVFTMLKKKGERVLRRAGCGTWTGQNKKEVKNNQGGLIGYDRLLTFKVLDAVKKTNADRGNWTMHEYSLHPNDYNYAICKITKEENARDEKLVGSDVVLQGFPHHQNMSNQAEPQADPLLDEEWSSYTETLNKILEPQEEAVEREAGDQMDALALKVLSDGNIFNKLAEPEGKEEQEQQGLLVEQEAQQVLLVEQEEQQVLPVEQGEQQVLLVEQEGQQVLLVEQEEQQVLLVEQEEQQVLSAEQEEQRQERERIAFITHLATNFNYYYGLQQQLEGGEIYSLGKRKNRSYHEDELSNNRKQQHTFVSSLN
ncbi:NAC domain-containing protein [Heracleum sosnowskyi]|uniref:NAC domain-containing protein n=1 Tax=Heracleum sosnowskyi TaxID=360622 RepID=A0AAD8IA25_9APIA|nr:NAC domain-containing protein [Heracleum sosnowskyi]